MHISTYVPDQVQKQFDYIPEQNSRQLIICPYQQLFEVEFYHSISHYQKPT